MPATLPAPSLLSLAQMVRENETAMHLLRMGNWPQATLCFMHHYRAAGLYTVKLTDVYKVMKIMRAAM